MFILRQSQVVASNVGNTAKAVLTYLGYISVVLYVRLEDSVCCMVGELLAIVASMQHATSSLK